MRISVSNLYTNFNVKIRNKLLGSAACVTAAAFAASSAGAADLEQNFDIPAQPLDRALMDFAVQSGINIMADATLAEGKRSQGVTATTEPEDALRVLLASSGLGFARDGDTIVIRSAAALDQQRAAAPLPAAIKASAQSAQTAPAVTAERDSADAAGRLDQILVTARRREEGIQDVPIAVSAFAGEALDAFKIEGGAELLRAIPNVAFTKTNFSMYNFSIRGVGTSAISAASDPGVAISFNNTPLIRNRLFEQEYYDVNRVEVLRGPQGTLYGRNATAGVVNFIPNLASTEEFEGFIRGEVGNFDSRRLSAMVNVPVTDTFALRFASAMTDRSGFDFNTFTGERVNGRDLWSTRVSAAWEPNDEFRANIIWERFEEDSNRSRTGKQLCTTDPGPEQVGGAAAPEGLIRNQLSQGCQARTLFSDDAFGAPNAGSFPAYVVAGLFIAPSANPEGGGNIPIVPPGVNPYEGVTQSRDLREIATSYDPRFRAQNDVIQLNLEIDVADNLTLYSQSAYAKDDFWSTQDYARYLSNDIFFDTSTAVRFDFLTGGFVPAPSPIAPGGIYTDPQLGPSSRLESADLNVSDNEQWYQELRLQSDYDGRFNFLLGANYLDFKTQDDYYVFNNLFTLFAEYFYNTDLNPGRPIGSPTIAAPCDENYNDFFLGIDPVLLDGITECVYVDPNSIDNLDGEGHNYFRSKNVVTTQSWAIFGEAYVDILPDLRFTGGFRYTEDEKTSTPFPTQLLLGATAGGNSGPLTGGFLRRGFRADPDVVQNWGAVTGRAVLDWSPDLAFPDDTLDYASSSRGYKGGGTNPPRADINTQVTQYLPLEGTFEPEYVNAFEIGTKNTLLDGSLLLNAAAFYYDYTDYQVSQIVDRTSLNENFDAEVWGFEIESNWQVTDHFRIDANVGYLQTRIGDGEGSIDVMNRTAGNEDWTVVRPWVQVPSNCIAPTEFVETILNAYDPDNLAFGDGNTSQALAALCAGSGRFGGYDPEFLDAFQEQFPGQFPRRFNEIYGFEYNPLVDAPNGGRGFETDLGGNELPNAPRWTVNVGAQYTFEFGDWELTPRADYYWQDKSFFRVYNTDYDRLEAWDNLNLSATLVSPVSGLVFQAYAKNVFDDTPISGAFTNSDDTQLTTNVFTLDPRILGFNITKSF